MANKSKPSPFRSAYRAAWVELQATKEQEKQLAIRRAQLQETLRALYPLVYKDQPIDIGSLTLSNAIRLIFRGTERMLSPVEVRGKLRDLGFNVDQYENPLANIHTALNRMADSDELVRAEDEDQKRYAAGKELKSVPEPEYPPVVPDVEGEQQ